MVCAQPNCTWPSAEGRLRTTVQSGRADTVASDSSFSRARRLARKATCHRRYVNDHDPAAVPACRAIGNAVHVPGSKLFGQPPTAVMPVIETPPILAIRRPGRQATPRHCLKTAMTRPHSPNDEAPRSLSMRYTWSAPLGPLTPAFRQSLGVNARADAIMLQQADAVRSEHLGVNAIAGSCFHDIARRGMAKQGRKLA